MPLNSVKVKVSTVMSNSAIPVLLLCPWNSAGKSTGVDCHFLLQVIFLTRGLNPDLPHRRRMFCFSYFGELDQSGFYWL